MRGQLSRTVLRGGGGRKVSSLPDYGNTLIALVVGYAAGVIAGTRGPLPGGWRDVGEIILTVVLLVASRDALRKYYVRAGRLLLPEEGAGGNAQER